MESKRRRRLLLGMLTGLVMLAAPVIAPSAVASPAEGGPVLTPVEGEPNLGVPPPAPALPADYEVKEYFLDGAARTYPDSGERVPYRTRILVRTPKDPTAFSGTVVVEWFNVSAQFDNVPVYADSFEAIHRRHDVFVGVSAQKAGVDFLKATNPLRYGSLNQPNDIYSFDIFSQAAYVLQNPGEHDALAGLRTRVVPKNKKKTTTKPVDIRLIGAGNSQSAGRLTSYIQNGAQRDAAVYDSLLVLNGGTTTFLGGDLPSVPVIHMQSESEASAPQPSAERPTGRLVHPQYRLWWVAGTSHTLHYHSSCNSTRRGAVVETSGGSSDRECGQYGELGGVGATCATRPNQFPKRYAAAAAIDALDAWMRNGQEAPPSSPEFVYSSGNTLARDVDSNVLGGLRLAPIDVPVASYVGNSCPTGLFGHTEPFQDAALRSRYATHDDYMEQLIPFVEANVADGYLLPEDAEDFLERAQAATFRWDGPISAPYPIGGR